MIVTSFVFHDGKVPRFWGDLEPAVLVAGGWWMKPHGEKIPFLGER